MRQLRYVVSFLVNFVFHVGVLHVCMLLATYRYMVSKDALTNVVVIKTVL